MKRYRHVCLSALFSGLFFLVLFGSAVAADYVGSEACATCHQQHHNDVVVSGHPYKLSRAEDARRRGTPLPQGYQWSDIAYVIGGAHKKIRYINKQGYIITAAKDGSELATQYNLETGTWVFYHKGEKKPYDCGRCHTTGYQAEGHQDGLPGIKGTWAAPGIQCEACHGPGSKHAKTRKKGDILVDRASTLCGTCHYRGETDTIPADGGFIRHHEQFNELLAGPHRSLSCVSCHNPHKRARLGIKRSCVNCHVVQARAFDGSTMQQVGVVCIDCHMPRAGKSAVAKSATEGDIRTHLFRINTDVSAQMFFDQTQDGKKQHFARPYLTLDFACLNCHKNKDKPWAAAMAKGIHAYGK